MRLPVVLVIACAASLLALNGTAQAQSRASSGLSGASSSGGLTGGSMFGSGASGGGLGGSTGGLGGSGGGLGGAGGAGGGAGGFGGAGGGAQQAGVGGQAALNTLGQQQNAGFIGRNGGNNQFIGANAAASNGQQGGQNRQGQGGRNAQRANTQNQFNQNGGGGGQNTFDRNAGVRPRQQVAFEYPKPKLSQVLTNIESRFKKLSKNNPSLNSVTLVSSDDGIVVLTGEARTQSEAKMAESLVRLEPGIRGVRNEMTFPAPVDTAQ